MKKKILTIIRQMPNLLLLNVSNTKLKEIASLKTILPTASIR